MVDELSHEQAVELLAAHALGAVPAAEADALERHLLTCADCRDELRAHRDTAGLLGMVFPDASPHVWRGIADRLAEPPPPQLRLVDGAGSVERRPGPPVAEPGRGRWSPRPGRVALAVAAVVVAVVAGVVVGRSVGDRGSSVLAEARAAAARPGNRTVTLRGDRGGDRVVVVVDEAASVAYVTGGSLDTPAPGRTYQLWSVVDGRPVSLGLIDARPEPTRVRLPAGTAALAVSDEPDGGSVSPHLPPVVAAEVS